MLHDGTIRESAKNILAPGREDVKCIEMVNAYLSESSYKLSAFAPWREIIPIRSAFAGENSVSEANMANELILIIEDNEKNRKLVRDVLQVKGYKTIETDTAEEGVKLALKESPALILMDIQLPGMDGITALKQLKAEVKTKNIPVIAVTASAMTYNRRTMLAEGFDGYQTKPISLKAFLGEIDRVLASPAS